MNINLCESAKQGVVAPLLHRHKIVVLLSALHEQILAVDEVVGGHSLVEGSKLLLVERHATALNELAHLTL